MEDSHSTNKTQILKVASLRNQLQAVDDMEVDLQNQGKKSAELASIGGLHSKPSVSYTNCDKYENKRKLDVFNQEICVNNNAVVIAKKCREDEGNKSHNYSEGDYQADAYDDHPIFATDVVMLKILGYLPFKDLQRCREVNSRFNFYALEIINQHGNSKILFTFDWSTNQYFSESRYFKNANKDMTQFTLEVFSQLLTTSPNIFNGSYYFLGGSLLAPDLQSFLHDHGQEIKSLSLQIHCPPTGEYETDSEHLEDQDEDNFIPLPDKICLAYLLTNQVPNLTFLELGDCPLKWGFETSLFHKDNPQAENILLPNLKVLRVRPRVPKSVFYDILKAGINLNEIYCYDGADIVMKAGKFQCLKTMLFKPDENNIEDYEAILPDTQCNSEVFMFGTYSPHEARSYNSEHKSRSLNSLANVLKASSSTLKEITWNPQIAFRPRDEIPTMPNVKAFKFQTKQFCLEGRGSDMILKKFPPGFQFVDSFPNLTHVKFQLCQICHEWEDYFDDYIPVPTVTSLTIHANYVPSKWFLYFSPLFPNIQSLDIAAGTLSLTDAAMCGLWSFTLLKKLVLQIDLEDIYNNYPALDSAFTGFSYETCKELYAVPYLYADSPEAEELRVYPSIRDLRNLEKLHLIFTDASDTVRPSYPLIVTHVTASYAFHSQLEVYQQINVNNSENVELLAETLRSMLLDGYTELQGCACALIEDRRQWQLTRWLESFSLL